MTINLSKMSMLAEQYDMEALSRGLASAKIRIRDKDYQFNHKEKIFDRRRPLGSSHFTKKDN